MPIELSVDFIRLLVEYACQKLGQPVPESNFLSELNSGFLQLMQ